MEKPERCLETDWSLNRSQQNVIAGGIAGCVAKSATAPLSRITILYQTHSMRVAGVEMSKFSTEDSLFRVFQSIYRQEGIMSFWKGNLTAIIHRFPYSGVNFAMYDLMKNEMKQGMFRHVICFFLC